MANEKRYLKKHLSVLLPQSQLKMLEKKIEQIGWFQNKIMDVWKKTDCHC